MFPYPGELFNKLWVTSK